MRGCVRVLFELFVSWLCVSNHLKLFFIVCLLVFVSGCAGTVIPCKKEGESFDPRSDPQGICCPGMRAHYLPDDPSEPPCTLSRPLLPTITGVQCTQVACERQVEDWVPIALAALVLIFMVVALIMGVAYALNFKELYAWGKNELFQVLATAVIVGAAFAIVNASDLLSGLMLSGVQPEIVHEYPTAFYVADYYLQVGVKILAGEYTTFTALNAGFGQWASMTVSLMPARVGFRLQPALVLRPIMDANAMMLNALGLGLAGMFGQIALLDFIREKMFALFLPIGIVLRSFPFTRSKGSAIIAIALGFYIIFPLTFYLDLQVLANHCNILSIGELSKCALASTSDVVRGLWNEIKLDVSKGTWETLSLMLFWAFMWPSKIVFFLTALIFALAPEILWFLIVLGFVLPFINIIITLTFTRELAKILGGDVNVSALTKII